MIIGLSSCQEKKEVHPTSAGRLSVRFIDKNNEINQSYMHYNNATVGFIVPSGGTRSFNSTSIGITGKQDANNKFETSIGFGTDYNTVTNLPELEPNGIYHVACSAGGQQFLTNVPWTPSNKDFVITRNDADSLGGTFRVKMEAMPQGSSTNYKEMEGYFCIAKKGIL